MLLISLTDQEVCSVREKVQEGEFQLFSEHFNGEKRKKKHIEQNYIIKESEERPQVWTSWKLNNLRKQQKNRR